MAPSPSIVLYMHEWFPPSRAAAWSLRSADVPYERKLMNARGETSKPWYHKDSVVGLMGHIREIPPYVVFTFYLPASSRRGQTPARAFAALFLFAEPELLSSPATLGQGCRRRWHAKWVHKNAAFRRRSFDPQPKPPAGQAPGLNPQHTIPTLVDGDFALGESRAICTYLINKYAPGHSLYPDCPQKRALVDRYLYFDIGTLYKSIGDYFYPKLMFGKEYDPEKEQKLKDALGFLEAFLAGQDFLTGSEATVADLSISCSLSMLEITAYGFPGFPTAEAYYNRLKKLPHWEECNAKGIESFKQFAAGKI
ncbi:glutathione S-transferase 1 [Tropilaelaps mercedesae]|uniref:Glutathione S-transferase 1 n=1 Tax=Tropilaelaps mercedesae TaxID=418985 RepID=A0A1V9XS21_9ACAR|nr:glutathione S-transferase 1 [Tropilaelaps mercedesae]